MLCIQEFVDIFCDRTHCKKDTTPNTPPKIAPTAGPYKAAPIAIGIIVNVISRPSVLIGINARIITMAENSAVRVNFLVDNFFNFKTSDTAPLTDAVLIFIINDAQTVKKKVVIKNNISFAF